MDKTLPFPSPFPPDLRTAGLFAASGRAEPERLAAGIAQLKAWGLHVAAGPHLAARHRTLAGTDAERLTDFTDLLVNPHVDVLLAARGGYGGARLLDRLDPALLARYPKPLLGYSDVTILHLARFRAGVASGLSGPLAAVEFARPPANDAEADALCFTLHSLHAAWLPQEHVGLPPGTRLETVKPGHAAGPVVPVNLTVLMSLLGTPYFPELAGTLLVIEDVNEPAYSIDRDLNHLRQAGILQRLAGLIIGRFTNVDEPEWLPEIFAEFAEAVPGPVVSGLPYGHLLPMVTVPVGREGLLDAMPGDRVRLAW